MRIKSFQYKWVNISTEAITNWVILDDIQYSLNTRTQIYNNELFHWWTASKTLWNLRLYTISGKIVWMTAEARENAMRTLNSIAIIWTWNEYFEFKFEDFTSWEYKSNCKVYTPISFDTQEKWVPIINFSFELLSDKPEYVSYSTTIDNTSYDPSVYFAWWIELGVVLWTELDWVNGIEVNNLWNFTARCKIQLIWNLVNPKIINHTNNRAYWLSTTTSNLVIDNTWTTFKVEDVGVDVSSNRTSWSVSILLNPWVNVLTLIADNDTTWTQVNIYFNNTFA